TGGGGVKHGPGGTKEGKLEKVQEELKSYDVKTTVAAADVSDMEAVTSAVESIRGELGPIDILLNNAGISKFGGFMDLTPEEWTNIINVNVNGVYYTTRAVLPEMIERNTGDIINISSTAGQKGGPIT